MLLQEQSGRIVNQSTQSTEHSSAPPYDADSECVERVLSPNETTSSGPSHAFTPNRVVPMFRKLPSSNSDRPKSSINRRQHADNIANKPQSLHKMPNWHVSPALPTKGSLTAVLPSSTGHDSHTSDYGMMPNRRFSNESDDTLNHFLKRRSSSSLDEYTQYSLIESNARQTSFASDERSHSSLSLSSASVSQVVLRPIAVSNANKDSFAQLQFPLLPVIPPIKVHSQKPEDKLSHSQVEDYQREQVKSNFAEPQYHTYHVLPFIHFSQTPQLTRQLSHEDIHQGEDVPPSTFQAYPRQDDQVSQQEICKIEDFPSLPADVCKNDDSTPLQTDVYQDEEPTSSETDVCPEWKITLSETEMCQEDETPPLQTEIYKEDETTPSQTKMYQEDEPAHLQTEVYQEDEPTPSQTEVCQDYEGTPSQIELYQEDKPTHSQTEVYLEYATPPSQTEVFQEDELPPSQTEVYQEEPTPSRTQVYLDESPPSQTEVYLDETPPAQTEMYQECDSPPLQTKVYQEEPTPPQTEVYLDESPPSQTEVYLDETPPAQTEVYLDETPPAQTEVYLDDTTPSQTEVYQDDAASLQTYVYENEEPITSQTGTYQEDDAPPSQTDVYEDEETKPLQTEVCLDEAAPSQTEMYQNKEPTHQSIKVSQPTYLFAEQRFDERGGHLALTIPEVFLTIPPGAIPENQPPVLITLCAVLEHDEIVDYSEIADYTQVSLTVICGPNGYHFKQNVILTYPHCIQKVDGSEIQALISSQGLGETHEYKPVKNDPGVAVVIDDYDVTWLLDHFSATKLTAKVCDNNRQFCATVYAGPFGDTPGLTGDMLEVRTHIYPEMHGLTEVNDINYV